MKVSRNIKRLLWLALAVFCLALYVFLVLRFGLGSPWEFLGATQLRAFVPALALFLIVGDLMRFVHLDCEEKPVDCVAERAGQRSKVKGERSEVGGQTEDENNLSPSLHGRHCSSDLLRKLGFASADMRTSAPTDNQQPTTHNPQPSPSSISPEDAALGEAYFNQARILPHQEIPDFADDGRYLSLLAKSAQTGYAPALAKFGEYAMRRGAWVEAYYWMWRAQRGGMSGLAAVMREIRRNWSASGFPDEAENVSPIFTRKAGSVGRALLDIASGHDAAAAREFLKANHPDFL